MATATLRKLGGSTVIAIPPVFLDALNCNVGDQLELSLNEDSVELRVKRKRLSLKERLDMYKKALPLKTEEEKAEEADWQNIRPVGREIL